MGCWLSLPHSQVYDHLYLRKVSSSIISCQSSVVLFELLGCCPVPAICVKVWHLLEWKERSSWSTRRTAINYLIANSNMEAFHVTHYRTVHTSHAGIHPYIYTFIHPYMHAYRQTCTRTCIRIGWHVICLCVLCCTVGIFRVCSQLLKL